MADVPATRRRHLRTWMRGEESWLLADPGQPGPLLDLASNDYLGLSRHPEVVAAAEQELRDQGLGSGGSRLVTGTRPSHSHLEEAIGAWLNRDRVLLYPSGFQASLAALSALADRHTTVIADRLIHHSLLVGIRASGARLIRYRHNDLDHLAQRLRQAKPPLVVVTESLFSMEGTSPDLEAIGALCAAHDAALLVDEAHALGVLGDGGRGLCHGLLTPVTLISGTFGKAFGSGGAFLACDGELGAQLLQSSGAFRYTTALAPPLAAGALRALQLIEQHPHWGDQLIRRAQTWRDRLVEAGWARPNGDGPVLPLVMGSDQAALDRQQQLEEKGLLTIAIRPPTVPEGASRLRLVLRRDLPEGSCSTLVAALGSP